MKPIKKKHFNKHSLLYSWLLLAVLLISFNGFTIPSTNSHKTQDTCVGKPIISKNKKALNFKNAIYVIDRQMNWSLYLIHAVQFAILRHNTLAEQQQFLSQFIFNEAVYPNYLLLKIHPEYALDTPFAILG